MNKMDNYLLQVCLIIQPFTSELYLVGGCVRDKLLGKLPNDYDIVISGDLELVKDALKQNDWSVSEVGQNFLVTTISKFDPINQETKIYEIALFRKDGTYSDGRRPDLVEVGTIFEDAIRRDFTINSLYLDPFSGLILDPTGKGLKDLENKLIRFNGSPKERIDEDKLRGIRLYRFAAKLNFDIDPIALRIVRRHFKEIIQGVNPERIRLELEKLL